MVVVLMEEKLQSKRELFGVPGHQRRTEAIYQRWHPVISNIPVVTYKNTAKRICPCFKSVRVPVYPSTTYTRARTHTLTLKAVPSSMMVGSWERQISTAKSQACLQGWNTETQTTLEWHHLIFKNNTSQVIIQKSYVLNSQMYYYNN